MSLANCCYKCTNTVIPTNLIVKELVFNYLGDIDVDSYLSDSIIKLAKDATDKANYAADVVDNLTVGKVRAQDVSTVDGSTQEEKNIEFLNELDALPFEDGVLADSLVVATPFSSNAVPLKQMQINAETLTPYRFGVKGSNNQETLGDRYDTLEDAQKIYPNAIDLTELADRVAFDSFLLYIKSKRVTGVDWGCSIVIEKPLVSYTNGATLNISGDLNIAPATKNVTSKSYIPYCIHIATSRLTITGNITLNGNKENDLRNRVLGYGVVLGAFNAMGVSLTGDAASTVVGRVTGNNLLGFALVFGANVHFSSAGHVRSSYCGSGRKHNTTKHLQGVVDSFSNAVTSGANVSQVSTITLVEGNLTTELSRIEGAVCTINGEPYDIRSYNLADNKLTISPALPDSVTSGELVYVFGGGAMTKSNNTACTSIGTLQSITSGYGLYAPALYGISVDCFISEFLGVGVFVGAKSEINIGNTINLGYFESNTCDIVYGHTQVRYTALTINQCIALNPNKIWQQQAYRVGEARRHDWATMRTGSFIHEGDVYRLDGNMHTIHTTTHKDFLRTGSTTVTLSYDRKLAELTTNLTKTLFYAGTSSTSNVLTFNAPSGMTINGGSTVVLNLHDYEGVVTVCFNVGITYNNHSTNMNMHVSGVRRVRKGTTENRPTNLVTGDRYLDTTLAAAGKPITWTGSDWVDALGAAV